MTTSTTPRPATVLTSGFATALYYATPDFIPSRTARGWAKALIVGVSLAAAVPEFRAALDASRVDGDAAPAVAFGSLPAAGKAVVVGSVAGVLAVSVRGMLTAERWAFRHGQARAAAGKRLPHTAPALVYGALSTGLWLLPTPSAPQ